MQYVFVFGLSADPIHQGHSAIVSDAFQSLCARGYDIVRIVMIPVYRRNPVGTDWKEHLPETYAQRFAMCELAARDIAEKLNNPVVRIVVSRIEERLARASGRPNYTVETLTALQSAEAAGRGMIFLLSSDLVSGDDPELAHWHQPDRLVRLAVIAICLRAIYPPNESFLRALEQKGARFVRLALAPRDISAKDIRARLGTGEDPLTLAGEGLLSERVAAYIKENRLYQPRRSS